MTYSPQLLIARPQLRLVPRVRPAAHEDLVPPFDPALRRRLPEVDLLSFVSARVRVEVDSGKRQGVCGGETRESIERKRRKEKRQRTASTQPLPAPQARPPPTAP
jgi:hypothetical protein